MAEKPKLSLTKFLFLLMIVWAVFILIGVANPETTPLNYTPPESRKGLPELSYPLIDGGSWRLSEFKGQPAVINLWATWCPPCHAETPGLVRVARNHPKVQFVGVSLDEGNVSAVRAFARDYRIPYPIATGVGAPGMTGQIALPSTLIIDRKGRLVTTATGAVDEKSLDHLLDQLEAEP
jgi:thiol-disulfide isomerase/thioredoxin